MITQKHQQNTYGFEIDVILGRFEYSECMENPINRACQPSGMVLSGCKLDAAGEHRALGIAVFRLVTIRQVIDL